MRLSFDTTDEVLVVTGGANGIGAGVAQAYADAGGHVVVLDVVTPEWEHPRMTAATVDVSDRDAVHAAVAQAEATHGRVDALVAAAAVQPRTDVAETTPDEWHRVLGVNLDGVVWATQAVLPGMRRRRSGSIVVFASGLVNVGHAQAGAYAATKGALVPWAKSLAAEVIDDRVRVNVLFPGVVDTPQFQRANPTGGQREHWEKTTGIGTPEDVAGPLMFLLSDAATMSGSVLTRDRAYHRLPDTPGGHPQEESA